MLATICGSIKEIEEKTVFQYVYINTCVGQRLKKIGHTGKRYNL